MNNKNLKRVWWIVFLTAIFIFAFSTIVLASNDKIFADMLASEQSYLETIQQISLIVAFVGGVLSFLTPCAIGIVPAYFAYSFQEKKELFKMTFFFFLGLLVVFIPIGLMASFIGKYLIIYRVELAFIAGVLLLFLGIFMILGKDFSFIKVKKKVQRNKLGVFLFGILFAIGFTPCNGPILAGITTLAATVNQFYAAVMFGLFALGIVFPLFVLSYFFDRLKISESALVRRGSFSFKLIGKEFKTHWTSVVAGLLFILVGIVFIIYRSTTIFSTAATNLGYPSEWAYGLQDVLLNNPLVKNISVVIAIVLLVLFIYLSHKLIKRKDV